MYNDNQGGYNFGKFLGDLQVGSQGKVKYGPNGEFIPVNQRRSAADVRRNPYGVNAGNAINPDVSFFNDILARSNPAPAMAVDPMEMMKKAGY